jgi:hypothetical protein
LYLESLYSSAGGSIAGLTRGIVLVVLDFCDGDLQVLKGDVLYPRQNLFRVEGRDSRGIQILAQTFNQLLEYRPKLCPIH